jgi:hypothetical protein
VFLIISYVFSSIKLENRAKQILPGREGHEGRRMGQGEKIGPNNVYTHE